MNPCIRIKRLRSATVIGAALLSLTSPLVRGATAPAATVPELFAGELEDVGPQFLLLAAPRFLRFELWTDLEITGTSNATLVESGLKASTITSAQFGGTWHLAERSFAGGRLAFETGFKFQTYRYGLLAGPKEKINFLEIDRNNFDLAGAHLQIGWRRNSWRAGLAFRGVSLRNRGNHRVFYEELATEWQVARQWHANPRRTWMLGLDGAARWSNTDSFGLLPNSWNSRIEQGLFAVLDQLLGARWRLQPALRVQGSRYLHRDRHRSDFHTSGRVNLVHPLGTAAELRLGIGYDRRTSSELMIADFHKWDLGLAGSARWRF
ncbi:MAG: hypothetical protein WCL04_10400 [Verrucomicrobiota bacterium]